MFVCVCVTRHARDTHTHTHTHSEDIVGRVVEPLHEAGLDGNDIAAVLSATAGAFQDLDALRVVCGNNVSRLYLTLVGAWRRFVFVIGLCAVRITQRTTTVSSPASSTFIHQPSRSSGNRMASNPW